MRDYIFIFKNFKTPRKLSDLPLFLLGFSLSLSLSLSLTLRMEAAATDVPTNLEGEGEGECAAPPSKKPRFDGEVNRVAEIVLVLSALRRIRGGKPPTELELELMVEAKSKLVDMCQEFPPKDIIGRDAIGAVIEDLGLNGKLKDQRLGFRAPKLTISEKLSLGKRKVSSFLLSID